MRTSCPGCDRESPVAARAIVAPFVAELARIPFDRSVSYRICPTCTLGFFDMRYSGSEVERLYAGYRAPEYVCVRRRWEPWYRSAVNDAHLPGSPAVRERVDFERSVLLEAGLPETLRCAVDFGGDRGQFFPDMPIARRFVIDISGQPLLEDVDAAESLGALPEAADLVIVAGVLEHLSDPRALLAEIHEALAPDGLLYAEVPLDAPRLRDWHSGRRYGSWLTFLVRHRYSLVLCDFATGVARQFRRPIPRLGVVKESEHLNYFNRRSLQTMLEASGFEVRAAREDVRWRQGGLQLGRLGMAARKAEPAAATSAGT